MGNTDKQGSDRSEIDWSSWDPRDWATDLQNELESLAILVRTRLWAQILLAMVLGLGVGLAISPQGGALLGADLGLALAKWLKLPGAVFLNLIQMVVIPLVISSIILGICSSGDPAYLKRVGLRIFPYFVGTTTIAVTIGVSLTLLIDPGSYVDASMLEGLGGAAASDIVPPPPASERSLPERLADLIPTNIESAMVTQDMLQVVVYAIIAGVAFVAMPSDRTSALRDLLENTQDLSLKIVGWAMMLAPYAVFGLLADIAIRVGFDAVLGMSAYLGTVLLGLLLLLGLYFVIIAFLGKTSPSSFISRIRDVQLLAFSTSSSAAVMPMSMQTAEEKLGVRATVAKFIVPLGATVNMDGTALYQASAALFLTQVYGIDMTTGQIVAFTATTVGASIGSPSTPGVGIVILATILVDVGVPASGIALIIGVDRILDMCRTAVNVSGDLTACVVMNRWLGEDQPSATDQVGSPPEAFR